MSDDEYDAQAWLECRATRTPFLNAPSFFRLEEGFAEPSTERVRQVESAAHKILDAHPEVRKRIDKLAREVNPRARCE